jgi:hypothetical protein
MTEESAPPWTAAADIPPDIFVREREDALNEMRLAAVDPNRLALSLQREPPCRDKRK